MKLSKLLKTEMDTREPVMTAFKLAAFSDAAYNTTLVILSDDDYINKVKISTIKKLLETVGYGIEVHAVRDGDRVQIDL